MKAEFQQRYGFGLTFLPFIARAAAEALRAFPLLTTISSLGRISLRSPDTLAIESLGVAVRLAAIALDRARADVAARSNEERLSLALSLVARFRLTTP